MNKKKYLKIICAILIFLYINPIQHIYVFFFAKMYTTDTYDGLTIQIIRDGSVFYQKKAFGDLENILNDLFCYYVYDDKIILCKYNYLVDGTFNFEYLVYHKDDETFSRYYSIGPVLHTEKEFDLQKSDDPHFKEDAYDIKLPGKWRLLSPVR